MRGNGNCILTAEKIYHLQRFFTLGVHFLGNAVLLLLAAFCPAGSAVAQEGSSVAVVYNSSMPESKSVAEYYSSRRQVPGRQVFGLPLPATEQISRSDFHNLLQEPLLKHFKSSKLFVPLPASAHDAEGGRPRLFHSKIRYLVLCYGVPVRISGDPNLKENGMEKLPPELKRNEASVDSDLALLPMSDLKLPLYGPLRNPFLNATNAALLDPTNGILMVARLDGPSAGIARGLVDKALEAERDGLWGRAYFDMRGLTNNYKQGDDWIQSAADVSRQLGYDVIVDARPETFSAGFPMSQIAFYAGWYEGQVCGPFTNPRVEFMPGAFAYHLHSFSAHLVRSPNQFWVGPLLEKGVTATIGFVEEPYLEGTIDLGSFFWRFLFLGFSFGEAAYASQNSLSWQTTVIGDPLYRPFAKKPPVQHQELNARGSRLIEWSHLRVINLLLIKNEPVRELIRYLQEQPETSKSAVLEEKLGDLYFSLGDSARSIEAYRQALRQEPTPQQRIRLKLLLASRLQLEDRDEEALNLYQEFCKEFPDYPELASVYQRMVPLAEKLGKTSLAEQWRKELERLSSPRP